ncbi:peptidase C78, ubiquitin fold modifier-specific peptidase 1/ 2 isoform X1 [Carex rostrata]
MQKMFSCCPVCNNQVLSNELEWHVNSHFEEDELDRDWELAQQVAMAPPSPNNNTTVEVDICFEDHGESSQASSSTADRKNHNEEISHLTKIQLKSDIYRVEGGLINLLRTCLYDEGEDFTSIVSGYVDHYQTLPTDRGWGCGWRNIQMLSSNLLRERKEGKKVLFGGSQFVPDIPALQRWLEIAWQRGFDEIGSSHYNSKIYGTKRWIGTTECAAIFRSFGLKARIVDFDSTESGDSRKRGKKRGKDVEANLFGPIDKFVVRGVGSDNHANTRSSDVIESRGREVLVDWIWKYFTGSASGCFDISQRVTVSEKTPLYFQHDGHSRTIVGIQMQKGFRGSQDRFFLLILDPAHKTTDLENTLKKQKGWKGMIKRGPLTLKKPQYQLCYIDPGIASSAEMEQLKTIDSTLISF